MKIPIYQMSLCKINLEDNKKQVKTHALVSERFKVNNVEISSSSGRAYSTWGCMDKARAACKAWASANGFSLFTLRSAPSGKLEFMSQACKRYDGQRKQEEHPTVAETQVILSADDNCRIKIPTVRSSDSRRIPRGFNALLIAQA